LHGIRFTERWLYDVENHGSMYEYCRGRGIECFFTFDDEKNSADPWEDEADWYAKYNSDISIIQLIIICLDFLLIINILNY